MFSKWAKKYIELGLFPIPARKASGKSPKFCHKVRDGASQDGVWSRAKARAYNHWNTEVAIGFLLDAPSPDAGAHDLRGLLVLDFDTAGLFEKDFLPRFPELTTCPLVRTKNGFHAYFRRSHLVEVARLTDGARQFFGDDGVTKMELDIKSYSKGGSDGRRTAGYIAVPPNNGKTWVEGRCILDTPITEVSDELVNFLLSRRVAERPAPPQAVSALKPRREAGDESRAGTASTRITAWWNLKPKDIWAASQPCLLGIGFLKPDHPAPINAPNEVCAGAGYCGGIEFKDTDGAKSRACPLCGKTDNHTSNFNWMMLRSKEDGGFGRYVLNYSSNCIPGGRHTALELPWTDAGVALWATHFMASAYELSPHVAAQVISLVFDVAPFVVGEPQPSSAWVRERLLIFPPDSDKFWRVVDLAAGDGRKALERRRLPWVSDVDERRWVGEPLALALALHADLSRQMPVSA